MLRREQLSRQDGSAMMASSAHLGSIPVHLAAGYPQAASGLTGYAELLATAGVQRGLIGPSEVPRIWERHIANCAVLEQVIPDSSHVADVGSGAGLPGLAIALVRPDLRITLIEPLLRRATFLAEAVDQLALRDQVTVIRSRAEDLTVTGMLTHGLPADVVTARAVANLSQLLTWCWPLVRNGGRFAVLKGETAAAEVTDARSVLKKLGIPPEGVEVQTIHYAGTQATVVVTDRSDQQG